MIRWCVVGLGWVAREYVIPAIQQARNAVLVATVDRGDTTDAEFDAVYIATPNDTHAALTAEWARRGKHVLCEKPMARTIAEAECMVKACREAGVQYATAFDQRFHPRHLQMREMIQRGKLGTICSARIHYACWLPPDWSADNWRVDPQRAGGGALIDLAPHGLDLLPMLLGDEWEEISVMKQRRVWDYAVDDGAVVMGRFAGGALATIQVGYNCPDAFPRRRLEVLGDRGMLQATDTMGQTAGGSLNWFGAEGSVCEIPEPALRDCSPFQLQIEAFSDAVAGGKPFAFTPEQDLHLMRLLNPWL